MPLLLEQFMIILSKYWVDNLPLGALTLALETTDSFKSYVLSPFPLLIIY